MEALEFTTTLQDNQILIPAEIKSALANNGDKTIRVIVLMEADCTPAYTQDDFIVKRTVSEHFLKGYADADSIYDNSFTK